MLLELKAVNSFYGKTPILQNISLGVEKGKCLCVLGRNGVGKTTLLRTICGLTDSMSGSLSISGTSAERLDTHERARLGIGYVPQGRQILGKFTVRQNIMLGTFARRDKVRDVPKLCLELFPYLADNLDKQSGLLSGGQQQQLAIARALASDPKILLLDEPTEGIQPNIVTQIESVLGTLNKELGITMILTEQHLQAARKLGHSFAMLDRGRIQLKGDMEQLTNEVVDKFLAL